VLTTHRSLRLHTFLLPLSGVSSQSSRLSTWGAPLFRVAVGRALLIWQFCIQKIFSHARGQSSIILDSRNRVGEIHFLRAGQCAWGASSTMAAHFRFTLISSLSIRTNIASWCFFEKRFAPVRHCGTAMKSESAPFSQWASGIQSNTVKRRERSSPMHSRSCNLRTLPTDALNFVLHQYAVCALGHSGPFGGPHTKMSSRENERPKIQVEQDDGGERLMRQRNGWIRSAVRRP